MSEHTKTFGGKWNTGGILDVENQNGAHCWGSDIGQQRQKEEGMKIRSREQRHHGREIKPATAEG